MNLPKFQDCKDSCLFELVKDVTINEIYKKYVEEACMKGCQEQHNSLVHFQTFYPTTSPDWLLGSAYEECFDGCLAMIEGGQYCAAGCDKMRNIQRKMMKTVNLSVKDKVEKKVNNFDNTKEDNAGHLNEGADNRNTWTYYLFSPGNGGFGAIQRYMSILNIMDNMFREINTLDIDKSKNDQSKDWRGEHRELNLPQYPASINDQSKGWQGDHRELDLPQYSARTAALTDDEDNYSQLQDKISNYLGRIKKKVQDTVVTRGFKETLLFILFCISVSMLLQSVFKDFLCSKEPQQPLDHFYLPPACSLPPKLPTYDECMKDSQKLCVGLTQQEDICKLNLSLPLVALQLGNGNEKNNVLGDVDMKQDDNEEKA